MEKEQKHRQNIDEMQKAANEYKEKSYKYDCLACISCEMFIFLQRIVSITLCKYKEEVDHEPASKHSYDGL